ncbi:hypothetical protein LCGC14_1522070 [marine sediment metagenome]|uniref:Uncharacterized protein n=1 Tax=marine sediment metagenome TaxID=412755 RepID=A0A0F9JJ87_9ZZZZ
MEIAVTDDKNPYKDLRTLLGKEDKETNLPSLSGVTSMREWDCGCILMRRAGFDGSLMDEPHPCEEHKEIISTY